MTHQWNFLLEFTNLDPTSLELDSSLPDLLILNAAVQVG
jgi:hypothetical protein